MTIKEDKELRRELAEKYLLAETSVREEKELRDGYRAMVHPDEEERLIASVLAVEHDLFGRTDAEFDEIMSRINASRRKKRRVILSVAASVLLLLGIFPFMSREKEETPAFSMTEIASGIQTIMDMGADNIESVTAVPSGSTVMLEVSFADGTEKTYVMTRDMLDGSLLFTAMNY